MTTTSRPVSSQAGLSSTVRLVRADTGDGFDAGGTVTYRVYLGDRWIGWVGDGREWRGWRYGARRWWACWRETGDTAARWHSDLAHPTRKSALTDLTTHHRSGGMNLPGKVRLHIHQASVDVEVDDLVACLWAAAQSGALDPGRVDTTEEATDLVRATVLYLLLTDHAGIVAARHHMTTIRPDTPLWPVIEQVRQYAASLFTIPDPRWDLTDQCPGGGL